MINQPKRQTDVSMVHHYLESHSSVTQEVYLHADGYVYAVLYLLVSVVVW